MADIDWDSLNAKLPLEKNEEDKAKRQELFKQFDPNGNGYLSLAEVCKISNNFTSFFWILKLCLQVDKGMRDVLQSDELFDCKQVRNKSILLVTRNPVSAPSAPDLLARPAGGNALRSLGEVLTF